MGTRSEIPLTCEVIFLWHVIPRKERYFEVVHVDESVAEMEKRNSHTTVREMPKMSAKLKLTASA